MNILCEYNEHWRSQNEWNWYCTCKEAVDMTKCGDDCPFKKIAEAITTSTSASTITIKKENEYDFNRKR